MKKIYIAMSAACVLLVILAYERGGFDLLAEGAGNGGLAGALMPGGPFVFYPVAATLLASGAVAYFIFT